MAPAPKRRRPNPVRSASIATSDRDDDEGTSVVNKTQSSDYFSSPVSANDVSSLASKNTLHRLPLTPSKSKTKKKATNHVANAATIHLPSQAQSRNAGSKSASTSPEKSRTKGKLSEISKSGDILKLFSSQLQRQKIAINGATNGTANGTTSAPYRSGSQPEAKADQDEYEITSDDDDVGDRKAQPASFVCAAAKKRSHGATLGDVDVVSSSQKFMRKLSLRPEVKRGEDMRPWAERFAPISLDELAVHKKKVTDVKAWLESVLNGRVRQRLLILKGAAGTGKTTAVQLLAKDMDLEVLEWRNPGGSVASSDGFVSMAAQFEEFIGRGGKYGQLEMFSEADAEPSKPTTEPLDRRKNIILVEEFPNTFTRSSTGLQSFRSSIIQYLVSNTPPLSMMYNMASKPDPVTPLIMVISETMLTTSTASADSFTAHRLLGPEILQHPGVTVIEFNAIAPTLLAKALELVVVKESRKSGRRKTPGPLVLKKLGEIGDIRSAIGSLEFLCIRGDEAGDWGARVSFAKSKKSVKDSIPMTKMEQDSLELVTRREASLGIFHAVGKVVYNKRDETTQVAPAYEAVDKLPEFLRDKARPRKSQVSVDELIDETGTDTQTFVAALHENYILSCDAPPNSGTSSDLDHVNGCIDALSDSDLVCPSWDGSFSSAGFSRGSGGDMLRQDEFCFQIAIRGILFSLPYPVKRRAPAAGGMRSGRGGDAFKMFYPTSLKLWRMKEEIEGTVNLWVTRMMKGESPSPSGGITAGAAAFTLPKPGSVETWRSNSNMDNIPEKKFSADNSDATPSVGIGASAKKEMLLERLPYMVMIARGKRVGSISPAIREMEKVIAFTGIGGPSSEDDNDEGADEAVTEEWATDKPTDGESPKKKTTERKWTRGTRPGREGLEARFIEQKLVLSDDDIEEFD